MKKDTPKLGNVIEIDEVGIKDHLGELVRGTVEQTLNSLLDAEVDRLCNAVCYERTQAWKNQRAGHYERTLHTQSGEMKLQMPELRQQTFEMAIIEHYRQRKAPVEESLIERNPAGVSVCRVKDITEALWGIRVTPGTVSNLTQQIYKQIEAWRNRPIEGEYAYVYLDGIVLKRSRADEVRNVSVLVAIGVGQDGFLKVLGITEGHRRTSRAGAVFSNTSNHAVPAVSG